MQVTQKITILLGDFDAKTKGFSKKRRWLEHVCKVLRFGMPFLILAGVWQSFSTTLQNRSENAKNDRLKG